MAIKYWRPSGCYGGDGNDIYDGSSWASGVASFTRLMAVTSTSDEIRIAKSPDPTVLATGVLCIKGSKTFVLPVDTIRTLDNCESGWIATNSATVTHQGGGTAKEGNNYLKITMPATTSGNILYAYHPTGLQNLSGYQRISFWYNVGTSTASGNYKLCLCSGTIGDGVINSVQIPATVLNTWTSYTLDNTSGLGSAINSMAIYSDSVTPAGGQSIYIDNIFACKASGQADSVSLESVLAIKSPYNTWASGTAYASGTIVKPTPAAMHNMLMYCSVSGISGSGEPTWPLLQTRTMEDGTRFPLISGDGSCSWECYNFDESEMWHPIQSIIGYSGLPTSGLIDNAITTFSAAGRGWNVTSGVYTVMKRECIDVSGLVPTAATANYLFTKGGTDAVPMVVTGGWNLNSGIIDGMTFFDSKNGYGYTVQPIAATVVKNIAGVRCNAPHTQGQTQNSLRKVYGIGYSTYWAMGQTNIISNGTTMWGYFDCCSAINNSTGNTSAVTLNQNFGVIRSLIVAGGYLGVQIYGSKGRAIGVYATNNNPGAGYSTGINIGNQGNYVKDIISIGNTNNIGAYAGMAVVNNWLGEGIAADVSINAVYDGVIVSQNHMQILGNHKIWWAYANGSWQTVTKRTGDTGAWDINVSNVLRTINSPVRFGYPITQLFAKCKAGVSITVKQWVMRDSANNGIKLVIPAYTYAGVDTDLVATASAGNTVWEQLTITFTPHETGLCPIEIWIWNSTLTTNHVYIGSFSQA